MITSASVQFFHVLINGETDNLLDSKIFARSLIDLVRKSRGIGESGEAELVELLFEICAKIRIDPDILPAWFYPERGQSPPQGRIDQDFQPPRRSASITRLDQFPLFYVLVDYVHNDGSSGDFARTGLLYLIETTSKSHSLEKWMIESDLAPQMASGLGALYSRLSRSPASLPEADIFSSAPRSVSSFEKAKQRHRMPGEFSDEESQVSQDNEPAESLQSVNAFLSYLAFWQDTLNHCSSVEVADTLLDHYQVLFVQQLLYPSLLESSDMEGGSTAAVVAHLYRILDALEQRQMLQRILDYLLSSRQKQERSGSSKRRPRMSISRRKSMDKLAAMIHGSEDPSPDLFNLLDLITLSLKSSRSQTNTAALKLVSIMLRKHHDLVFTTLFKLKPCDSIFQSRKSFDEDLIVLFRAATGIIGTPRMDQSYQALLEDVQFMLNEHNCDLSFDEEGLQLASPTPRIFEIQEDCRLMSTMHDLFHTFFTNDTITNIALTETVMCLASCKHVTLRGWLTRNPEDTSLSGQSSLVDILELQVEQIKRWRSQIQKWDELFTMQQTRLLGAPEKMYMPKLPERASFDRSISPIGVGIPNVSPSPLGTTGVDHGSEDNTGLSNYETLLRTPIELPKREESLNIPESLPSLAERLSLEPRPMLSSTPSEGMSSGAVTPSLAGLNARSSVSLEHILTNSIILQEFLLEIAAVVQIRASLFGEVESVVEE